MIWKEWGKGNGVVGIALTLRIMVMFHRPKEKKSVNVNQDECMQSVGDQEDPKWDANSTSET